MRYIFVYKRLYSAINSRSVSVVSNEGLNIVAWKGVLKNSYKAPLFWTLRKRKYYEEM